MDSDRCSPGVSGTHQGRMSDSKQLKPDLSGIRETEKMQVAIGFPMSAVLDERFSWEETVSKDKTMSWQLPVERRCLKGVAGSAPVSSAERRQSIHQKISVWRIRSQARSTSGPHIHRKERISYLFARWRATPSKLTITQIASCINKWFPTQWFKIFPWETVSEEIKRSFWELYFFFPLIKSNVNVKRDHWCVWKFSAGHETL